MAGVDILCCCVQKMSVLWFDDSFARRLKKAREKSLSGLFNLWALFALVMRGNVWCLGAISKLDILGWNDILSK
jgi:hypothetical protein